jgi:hypothetical protein
VEYVRWWATKRVEPWRPPPRRRVSGRDGAPAEGASGGGRHRAETAHAVAWSGGGGGKKGRRAPLLRVRRSALLLRASGLSYRRILGSVARARGRGTAADCPFAPRLPDILHLRSLH